MKNTLLVLPIVLVISIAIWGSFGLQAKANPEWLEYRNEELGYSIQYPATCTPGRMPGECKQNPPEEMPQECICFLNAEDPDRVFLQTFQGGEDQNLTLASFTIAHYPTPTFNPPADAELVSWIKTHFSELYVNIPEKPNTQVDGIPAVSINVESYPTANLVQDILFIKDNRLFCITMLNPGHEENQALYGLLLSSFSWQD